MNPILSDSLTLFAQELQRFLSPKALQEMARKTKFVQRSSKYQANELIALCVRLSQEVASTYLTELCRRENSAGIDLLSGQFLNAQLGAGKRIMTKRMARSALPQ